MQLNKKLALLAVTASITPMLFADGSDKASTKFTYYKENNDRITVKYGGADITKDIGADYTISLGLSYDAISGGTPIWDSISGASSGVQSDDVTGASECISASGSYICQNTRDEGLIGDGQKDMSDFAYRNVRIEDDRKAATFSLTKRTPSRDEISFGVSYSTESDFRSTEGSLSYLYNIDTTRNKTISAGISYQVNKAKHDSEWKDFYVLSGEVGYTQIFTKHTLANFNVFGSRQSGVLDNPYQRVIRYFNVAREGNDDHYKYYRAKEKRPDFKKAFGSSAKLVTKIMPKVDLHAGYRIYKDSWGILSHTLSTSAYIDINKYITIQPLLRYYTQSNAVFYKSHKASDVTFSQHSYASNDERLGSYHTMTYGLGLIGKISKNFSTNLHYVYQDQSNGLKINYASLGIDYKF